LDEGLLGQKSQEGGRQDPRKARGRNGRIERRKREGNEIGARGFKGSAGGGSSQGRKKRKRGERAWYIWNQRVSLGKKGGVGIHQIKQGKDNARGGKRGGSC